MSGLGSNYGNDEMHGNTVANANLSVNHALNSANGLNVSHVSGVSWAAVLAGALAATALMLVLTILGLGFGMSSVSVWSGQGISAGALGVTAIVWIAFTQIIAYGMGGYLAGRLRVKWVAVHDDEVYFRDTAHGFLTWAFASILCATLLASAIGKIGGGAANASANLVGGISTAAMGAAASNMQSDEFSNAGVNNPVQYMVASMFRQGTTSANNSAISNTATDASSFTKINNDTQSPSLNISNTNSSNQVAEVMSIFVNYSNAPTLPPADINYAGQLIAKQTGLSQSEAESRVATSFKTLQDKKAQATLAAKEMAEKARKTAANTALWFFALLLIGAFSATLAATWGGKSRDH